MDEQPEEAGEERGVLIPQPFALCVEKEVKNLYSKKDGNAKVPSLLGGFDRLLTATGILNLAHVSTEVGKPIAISKSINFKRNSLHETILELHRDSRGYKILTNNQKFYDFVTEVIPESKQLAGSSLFLLDTHSFFYKYYSDKATYFNKDGEPIDLLKRTGGFIKWLLTQPFTHIIFASESAHSLRKETYPFYKGKRPPTPKAFWQQIIMCNKFLEYIGLPPRRILGYEADDVIASATDKFHVQVPITVMSNDKDLLQLYSYPGYKQIRMDKTPMSPEYVKEKYGIKPSQFLDFQTMCGDSSDNIPGVKGIGPKRAQVLLNKHRSLEGILNNIRKLDAKTRAMFEENAQNLAEARDLVYLRRHLMSEASLDSFVFNKRLVAHRATEKLKEYGIVF